VERPNGQKKQNSKYSERKQGPKIKQGGKAPQNKAARHLFLSSPENGINNIVMNINERPPEYRQPPFPPTILRRGIRGSVRRRRGSVADERGRRMQQTPRDGV